MFCTGESAVSVNQFSWEITKETKEAPRTLILDCTLNNWSAHVCICLNVYFSYLETACRYSEMLKISVRREPCQISAKKMKWGWGWVLWRYRGKCCELDRRGRVAPLHTLTSRDTVTLWSKEVNAMISPELLLLHALSEQNGPLHHCTLPQSGI